MANKANVVATPAVATPAPVALALASPLPNSYKLPKAGTARAAWLAALQASVAQGHTAAQFTAACLANPPSTPKTGKLANTCEPPSGWLRHFKGAGVLVAGY
jgi:hypothetical protein